MRPSVRPTPAPTSNPTPLPSAATMQVVVVVNQTISGVSQEDFLSSPNVQATFLDALKSVTTLPSIDPPSVRLGTVRQVVCGCDGECARKTLDNDFSDDTPRSSKTKSYFRGHIEDVAKSMQESNGPGIVVSSLLTYSFPSDSFAPAAIFADVASELQASVESGEFLSQLQDDNEFFAVAALSASCLVLDFEVSESGESKVAKEDEALLSAAFLSGIVVGGFVVLLGVAVFFGLKYAGVVSKGAFSTVVVAKYAKVHPSSGADAGQEELDDTSAGTLDIVDSEASVSIMTHD
eukprot:gene23511-28517_t